MKFIYIDNAQKENKLTFRKKGEYVVFFFNYSGEIYFDIRLREVRLHVLGLYIGTENDSFNLKTTQRHKVGYSYSDLLVKGVFDKSSKFYMTG